MIKHKLKPCPFCGTPFKIYQDEYGEYHGCESCGARGPFEQYGKKLSWNNRPIEDELIQELRIARKEIWALDKYDADDNLIIKRIDAALAKAKGEKQK